METEYPETLEACHRLIDQLHEALTTRDLIGQAKGILMGANGMSDEDAFLILVRASQRTNRKLRHIAADIVTARTADGSQDSHLAADALRTSESTVIALTGEIDMSTATLITESSQPALAAGVRELIFDMSDLTFLDSYGLRALVEVRAALVARGGRLALRSPARSVRRIIDIAGLATLLPIEPSEHTQAAPETGC